MVQDGGDVLVQGTEEDYRQAIGSYEDLVGRFPQVPHLRRLLAGAHFMLGFALAAAKSGDADASFRRALELQRALVEEFSVIPLYRAELQETLHEWARLLASAGRCTEAVAAFEEVIALAEGLSAEQPRVRSYRADVARGYLNLATHALTDPERKKKALREGAARCEALAAEFAAIVRYRDNLAIALGHLGDMLLARQPEEAEQTFARYREVMDSVLKQRPATAADVRDLASYADKSALLLLALNRPEEALARFREGFAHAARLLSEFGDAPDNRVVAANLHWHMGGFFLKKSPDDAIASYGRAAELFRSLASEFQSNANFARFLAASLTNLAWLLSNANRPMEAQAAILEASAVAERVLAAKLPMDEEGRQVLRMVLSNGLPLQKERDALRIYRQLLGLDPQDAMALNNLAMILANASDPGLRDPAEALRLAEEAVRLLPQEGNYQGTLGLARYRVGDWQAALVALGKSVELGSGGNAFLVAMAHGQLGEKDRAWEWYDGGIAWLKEHQPEGEELRRFREEAAELLGVR